LRESPAGHIIKALSEGTPIHLLYQRTVVNGIEWLELQDPLLQTGWVQAIYVIIRP